jgi:hypothetical protein
MAKPPTALALGILVLLWAIPAGGFSLRRIPIAIFCALALCLASALIIDGSPVAFVSRYTASLADMKASGAGSEYGLLAGIRADQMEGVKMPPILPSIALLFGGGVLISLASGARRPRLFATLLGAAFVLFCLTLALDPRGHRHTLIQGWAPLPLLAGAWAYACASPAFRLPSRIGRSRRRPFIAAATFLLLFPIVYGFGSNSPLAFSAPAASALMVGGFLVLIGRRGGKAGLRLLVGTAFLCQLLGLTGLAASWGAPFRQTGPLWEMHEEAPLREGGPLMRVAPVQARFLAHLHVTARRAGFAPGTPLIDLTGVYPLAVFAASGRSFGSPFMVGGYSWSDGAARGIAGRIPCEAAASSWLVWTDRPLFMPINPEILSSAGLDFPNGYQGAFTIPGFWGDGLGNPEILYFLEPKDPRANLERCLAVRGKLNGETARD